MSNETINPIPHSALGTVSGTTLGAVGGGLKGVGKALLYGVALGAIIGGAWGVGLLGFAATAAGISGGTVGWTVLGVLGGGLLGGVLGTAVAPATGIIGTVKGGSNAASRIRAEKGAANMVDAQLQAYQAQAYAAAAAPTTVYAPTAANNNYATASTMNQAGTKIQADSAQDLGTINGMQLQRA